MIIGYVRTIVLYCVLIAVIRLMGKRQIGEMEPSEFVVTMLLADLASVPMQDTGIPLLSGLIPIVTVLSLELLLTALSMRSLTARKILCGKPVILMENGKILQQNLKKTRLTLDELTELLRNEGYLDLSEVQYAILETNGKLSIFPYAAHKPPSAEVLGVVVRPLSLPVTIISDGRILWENILVAGRDKAWLDETLREYGCTADMVYLLTASEDGTLYFARRGEA